jgi:O-antigen ligase
MTPVTSTTASRQNAPIESLLLYGTFGLLMFGPLAFGAVEPWSLFLLEIGAAALFLLWVWNQILTRQLNVRGNPLFLPMGAFGLLIVLQIAFRLTAYRHDTISDALAYGSYAILCFVSGQALLRTAQVRRLAAVLSVYGAAVASFALLQGISANGRLYWVRLPRLGGWIYGPYVNHNHYAGLMEMLLPIPLVLSLTKMASGKERAAAAAAAAIMAGTIFLSGSRGGMLAFVAELAILGVVLVKQKQGIRLAISLGLFFAIVVGLMTWVGGGELSKRLATIGSATHSDLSGDMRLNVNRDALRMFLKHPIVGWGLGAFPVAYPQFRSFYTNFFVNQAHDDYLQLLVETGVLGFGIMIWFLVLAYRGALKKIANWSRDAGDAMALACLLAITGILVHSLVDFNLEIPANAAWFYVLCTLAASAPMAKPLRKRKPMRTPTPERLPASEVV